MQKAMGAHAFFSAESIFGTCTSRMSRGPDADWILCSACRYNRANYNRKTYTGISSSKSIMYQDPRNNQLLLDEILGLNVVRTNQESITSFKFIQALPCSSMEHKSQTQQQQDNTQHVIQDPSLKLLCFVISANHARH